MTRRSTLLAAAAAVTVALTSVPFVANAAEVDPTPGQNRIVGGKPATQGQFPWMVRLSMGCGGTLVSPDIVISAAHCFSPSTKSVTTYNGDIEWSKGQKNQSTKFRIGTPPNKPTPKDWAVLKLDQPYSGVTQFPVFPATDKYNAVPTFRAAGWGATKEGGSGSKTLLYVDVPLVPDTDRSCSKSPSTEICAGDLKKGGIDTCQGDSGGPLLSPKNGSMDVKPDEWVLVGMTSWGEGCARPNYPGHYAELTAVRTEVLNAIKELGGQAPANMETV
ncbi:trypsin [Pilimelia anulata]|uniref:Trypsin n=2 Tax=Pilimelia anulata TaxID=53371 RepID=A0A8J3B826_9ACTN|nr:trypsin [Pilimelia anulata]